MKEDAQPNERPLRRKGAPIPAIRSVRASSNNNSGGPFQRGSGNSFKRGFAIPHYSGNRLHPPSTQTSFRDQLDNGERQPNKHLYEHPRAKRRRVDYHNNDQDSQWRYGSTSTIAPRHPQERTGAEATELLVTIPPECRKGAPGCKNLRKEWIKFETERIYQQSGVRVEYIGVLGDSARFISRGAIAGEKQADPSANPFAKVWAVLTDLIDAASRQGDSATIGVQVSNFQKPPSLLCRTLSTNHNSRQPPPTPLGTVERTQRRFISGTLYISPAVSLERTPSSEYDSFMKEVPTAPVQLPVSSLPTVSTEAIYIGPISPVSDYPDSPGPQSLDCDSVLYSPPDRRRALSSGPIHDGSHSPGHASSSGAGYLQQAKNVSTRVSSTGPKSLFRSSQMSSSSTGLHTTSHHPVRASEHNMGTIGVPIRLSTQQHDKSRRLLPFVTKPYALVISMRGAVDLVETTPLRYRHVLKASKSSGESIDDACILQAGNGCLAIFGHARDLGQLSWCQLQIDSNQVSDFRLLNRPWNTGKKGGVSVVASMMQPLQFATGGYDHVVHLWDIKSDLTSATPRPLAIKHTSQIQSLLAIQDTSHKLISTGADCNVHIWDLASERVTNTLKTSNSPYHVHPTSSPFCTLLEVAHRELQFEVRDHRRFPEHPVQRFGYTTDMVHGRYIKGDTSLNLFACGSRDGTIRMWDLRNVKAVPATISSGLNHKITQVVFRGSQFMTMSENGQMVAVDYNGE